MNGLHGTFHGLVDQDGAAVRLQNIDGNVRSDFLDKFLNILHEALINVLNGGIKIGRGDAAWKIQLSRERMAQRNVSGIIPQQFGRIYFLLRIAAGKFADDSDVPDLILSNLAADLVDLPAVHIFDGNAPVIDVAPGKINIFAEVQRFRRQPGTAQQNHGHAVGFVLDNRVGRDRGAQYDPVNIIDILVGNQLLCRFQKRGHDICRICEDFCFPDQLKIPDQNCICVGSADVNAKYHSSVLLVIFFVCIYV